MDLVFLSLAKRIAPTQGELVFAVELPARLLRKGIFEPGSSRYPPASRMLIGGNAGLRSATSHLYLSHEPVSAGRATYLHMRGCQLAW